MNARVFSPAQAKHAVLDACRWSTRMWPVLANRKKAGRASLALTLATLCLAPSLYVSRPAWPVVVTGVPVAEIERKAYAGDPDSEYTLGNWYYCGYPGFKMHPRVAVEWYFKAARQGHIRAEEAVGEMYEFGEGFFRPDHEKALKWIRKAMTKDPSAAMGIGYRYDKGLRYDSNPNCHAAAGGHRDPEKAIEWSGISAQAGSKMAQTSLGELYEGDSSVQNLKEALRWYREAAAQNYAPAMAHLARLFATGKGVLQDYAEAAQWYRTAMATDGQTGRYELGLLYEQGLGVTAAREQAMELYYAEALGNADARQRLFKVYEADLDLPVELDKTIAWYRAAAEQGNRRAQVGLGLHYQFGNGVPQDWRVAAALYVIAQQPAGPPEDIPAFIKSIDTRNLYRDEATRAQVKEMAKPGNLLKSIEWFIAHPEPEYILE